MQNRKHSMPNEGYTPTATGNVRPIFEFPISKILDKEEPQPTTEEKLVWWRRLLRDWGVLVMPNSHTEKQPGFYVSWVSISGILGILALIGGLYVYTSNVHYNSGFKDGKAETEKLQLMKEIEKAQKDADEAKKLGIYAARGTDDESGHTKKQEKK